MPSSGRITFDLPKTERRDFRETPSLGRLDYDRMPFDRKSPSVHFDSSLPHVQRQQHLRRTPSMELDRIPSRDYLKVTRQTPVRDIPRLARATSVPALTISDALKQIPTDQLDLRAGRPELDISWTLPQRSPQLYLGREPGLKERDMEGLRIPTAFEDDLRSPLDTYRFTRAGSVPVLQRSQSLRDISLDHLRIPEYEIPRSYSPFERHMPDSYHFLKPTDARPTERLERPRITESPYRPYVPGDLYIRRVSEPRADSEYPRRTPSIDQLSTVSGRPLLDQPTERLQIHTGPYVPLSRSSGPSMYSPREIEYPWQVLPRTRGTDLEMDFYDRPIMALETQFPTLSRQTLGGAPWDGPRLRSPSVAHEYPQKYQPILQVRDINIGSVDLHWDRPVSAIPIAEYRIEQWQPTTLRWELKAQVPGSAQDYKALGLKSGDEYRFRVIPIDSAERELPPISMYRSVVPTGKAQPPGPVWGLRVAPDDRTAHVEWLRPSTDGGAPLTGYRMELVDLDTGKVDLLPQREAAASGPIQLRDLRPDTTYVLRVSAVNRAGVSPSVDSSPFTIRRQWRIPAPPVGVKTSRPGPDFNLSWMPPDVHSDIRPSAYLIESWDSISREWTPYKKVPPHTLSVPLPHLREGINYSFRVRSQSGPHVSEPTMLKHFIRPDLSHKERRLPLPEEDVSYYTRPYERKPARPSGPLAMSHVLDNTVIRLSWNAPDASYGGPVRRYRIEGLVGREWVPLARVPDYTKSFDVRRKGADHWIGFRVTAENEAGLSEPLASDVRHEPRAFSPVVEYRRIDAPRGPLRFLQLDSDRSIEISWQPPTNVQNLLGYSLLYREPYNTIWRPLALVGKHRTTFRIPYDDALGLIGSDTLTLQVRARDQYGDSEPLETSIFIRKPFIPSTTWDVQGTPRITALDLSARPSMPHVPSVSDLFVRGTPIGVGRMSVEWSPFPCHVDGHHLDGYVIFKREEGVPSWSEVSRVDHFIKKATVDGLRPDRKYHFGVAPIIGYRVGDILSTERSIAPVDEASKRPSGPEGPLRYEPCGVDAILVKWRPSTSRAVTGYLIERRPVWGSIWLRIGEAGPTATSYKISPVHDGETMDFRVTALGDAGSRSQPLETITPYTFKSPLDVPAQPRGPLSVSPKSPDDGMALSWLPPSDDGGSPIDHYIIERRPFGHHSWLRIASTKLPQLTTSRLQPGERYELRVIAVNAQGRSPALTLSRPVIIPMAPAPPPQPLGPLRVDVPFLDRVTLSWRPASTAVVDDSFRYVIESRRAPLDADTATDEWRAVREVPAGRHSVDVEVPSGLDLLQFRVRGRSDLGDSAALTSRPLAVAKDRWSLTAPRGHIDTDVDIDGSVSLSWSAVPDASDYVVQRRIAEGKWHTMAIVPRAAVDALSFVDAGPPDQQIIKYRVAGRDGRGIGLFTESDDVCIRPLTRRPGMLVLPPVPSFEAHFLGKEKLQLRWTPPDYEHPVKYHVEEWDELRRRWFTRAHGKETHIDILLRELEEERLYFYRITAVGKTGMSRPVLLSRPVIRPKINRTPEKPLGFIAEDTRRGTISCSWLKPLSDGGLPIQHYIIQVYTEATSSWTDLAVVKGNKMEHEIEGLSDGYCYSLRIVAVNESGRSEATLGPIVYLSRVPGPPPAIPGTLDVFDRDTADGGVLLRWKLQKCREEMRESQWRRDIYDEDELSAIRVEMSSGIQPGWTFLKEVSPHTRQVLVPQTVTSADDIYKFRIIPVRKDLSGPPTESVEYRPTPTYFPPSAPEPPFSIERHDASSLRLQWSVPAESGSSPISSYHVEKRSLGRREWYSVADSVETSTILRFRPDEEPFVLRVRARNQFGFGEPLESNTAKPVIPEKASGPPGRPSELLVLHVGSSNVLLRWNPTETSKYGPTRHYVLEICDVDGSGLWRPTAHLPSNVFIFDITGLRPDSRYKIRLYAANDAGRSEPLELRDAIRTTRQVGAATLPGAPGNLEATQLREDRRVKLKWTAPKTIESSDTKLSYFIESRPVDGGPWIRAIRESVSRTEVTVDNLRDSTPYMFRVFSENQYGRGGVTLLPEPITVRTVGSDKSAPVFVRKLPDEVRCRIGDTLELEIELDGSPKPSAKWYLNFKEIFSTHRIRVVSIGERHKLVINDIIEDDNGEIEVHASNYVGSVTSKSKIIIESPARIQRSRLHTAHDYELSRGERLQIHVLFTGQPPARVSIFKDGAPFLPESRVGASVQCARQHVQLTIRDIERADAGEYAFVVENELGQDRETATVTVFDRPTERPTRLSARIKDRSSAQIEWEMSESAQSRERITNFLVEACRADKPERWNRLGTCKRQTFTASNLLEGEKYQFRVSAENVYGRGDPSEPSDWLLIQRFVWREEESYTTRLSEQLRKRPVASHADITKYYDLGDEIYRFNHVTLVRAIDRRTENPCLVKIVRHATPSIEKSISREVDAICALYHETMLPVYEIFTWRSSTAIAFRLITGDDVYQSFLNGPAVRTELAIRDVFTQICTFLQHVHSHGYIHLGITFYQLFRHTSASGTVYALESGNCLKLSPNATDEARFHSFHHLAPEVVSEGLVGGPADLWSLGVLLYALVSGHWPFDDTDSTRLSRAITAGRVDFSDSVWRQVSVELVDLITKLLSVDPHARPTAVAALRHPWTRLNAVRLENNLNITRATPASILALYKDTAGELPIRRMVRCSPAALNVPESPVRVLNVRLDAPMQRPSVLTNLSAAGVDEGSDVTLVCKFEGHPAGDVTWTFNGVDVSLIDNPRYSPKWEAGTATLTIREAAVYDSGTYAVTCDNGFGTASDSTNVSVRRRRDFLPISGRQSVDSLAAKIELPLLDQEIKALDTLELSIRVTGTPRPKVQWFFKGSELQNSARARIISAGDSDILRILKAQITDSGEYSVVASNKYGDTRSTCGVTILSPELAVPTFLKGLNALTVMEGDPIRLEVQLCDDEDARIQWMKNRRSLRESGKVVEKKEISRGRYLLTIPSASVEDSATYTFCASNEGGKVYTECDVIVRSLSVRRRSEVSRAARVQPPEFSRRLRDKRVALNESCVLSASIMAIPEPSIHWLKDEEQIQDLGLYEIKSSHGHTELTIRRMTKDTAGVFTAVAFNVAGEVRSSCTVSLMSEQSGPARRPKFTQEPSSVSTQAGSRVVFEARAVGEPTPEFKWERDGLDLLPDTDMPRTYTESDGAGHTRLVVKQASRPDEGLYRCTAFNQIGRTKRSAFLWITEDTSSDTGKTRPRDVSAPSVTKEKEKAASACSEDEALQMTTSFCDETCVVEGEPLELSCQVNTSEFALVTWTKGNRTLTYDGRHRVTKSAGHHSMIIDRVMANDGGKYTVTVETEKKKLQASTRVEVFSSRSKLKRQQSYDSDLSSISGPGSRAMSPLLEK